MPGCPPKVIARDVPGTSAALPGALARATDAAPMTSGTEPFSALATRMRTRVPPTDTRTRLRTVDRAGPPSADPAGDAPHAATQSAARAGAAAAVTRTTAASAKPARLKTTTRA